MKTTITFLSTFAIALFVSLSFNTAKAQLSATITSTTNISCNGGYNGTATVTANGGTSPYTYSWAPIGGSNATGTGLIAGTYTVMVTDAISNTTNAIATITQPPVLGATTSFSAASCNLNNGSATVNATGGTSPYTYYWHVSGQNTSTATGLGVGAYWAIITDNNGCSATSATITITQPAEVAITVVSVSNLQCNGGNNGSIDVSVSGGISPYSYSWAPVGGTNATVTGLGAGGYTITVIDGTGCATSKIVTITQPAPIPLYTNIVSCSCTDNGCAVVSTTGGTAPITYAWSPSGATGDTVCGLSVGIYTITATDAGGCSATTSLKITSTLTITPSITQNTSCITPNGTATATVSGGISPYTYSWSPYGGTNATTTGLGMGTYTVTVTDPYGDQGTASVAISQPSSIGATGSFTPATCSLNNGSATVSATGGITPYTYLWVPSNQTSATATGLSAGIYNAIVTDNSGCSVTTNINVTQVSGITISVLSVNYISCNGGNNGSIDISASGGTIPYTYSWPTGGYTAYETGLTAGLYTVTITDGNGCSGSATVAVTQPPVLTVGAQISSNISCNGGNNGCATASATGGTPPYSYAWFPIGGTGATECGLGAGIYTVTVTDAHGCSATSKATITQPPLLIVNGQVSSNVTCYGLSDGCVTTIVTGGTSPYTYLWEPTGANYIPFCGIPAGTYTISVTDANGCVATSTASPAQPRVLTTTSFMTQNTSCVNPNGTATVIASGGTLPYTYLWEPEGRTTATASGLESGTYTCTVTDKHGCYDTTSIVVTGSGSGVNTYVEPICILTIDTANNKTEVIWGRTNSPPAGGHGYYKLYKDSIGGYVPVHTQPLDSLSRFVDLLSDPSSAPQSYKLSTVDSCGESALSPPHTSIYLTTTAGTNVFILNWTAYVGFTPLRYRIFRGPSLSRLTQIDSVPNNVFTYRDTFPPSGSFYVLEAVNPTTACIPTTHGPSRHTKISLLSGSFSNGFNTATLGIENIGNAVANLKMFPNPSNGIVTVEWTGISGQSSVVRISIINELGQEVYVEQKQVNMGANKAQLNVQTLASGIYSLRIQTNNGITVRKLVIMGNK